MQLFRKIVKILAFLIGLLLLANAAIWLVMTSSGAVSTGAIAGYLASAAFLLAAFSFLVFPFSTRLAKLSGTLVLLALACGMLWAVFRLNLPVESPKLAQIAAIAFGVLLLARVGLALRRKHSGVGT